MNLRSLVGTVIVVLMMALVGCTTPARAPAPMPPVVISENTWRQVDQEILAAAIAAQEPLKDYVRGSMDGWRVRVHERTETVFIPWYTSYWTQQWMAYRVGWYKLSAGKDTDEAVKRLAGYLQEQYLDLVLDPVALELDAGVIMEEATKYYVLLLAEELQVIAKRHGIPLDQFNRRLTGIPAITLTDKAHSASLYQLIYADPIEKLPAYVSLVDRFRKGAAAPQSGSLSVARWASAKLESTLTTRSAASAAAAAVGRAAGMVISLGASSFSAIMHESDIPEMEAQLRKNLYPAFDSEWLRLLKNPGTGVMSGINYITGQIEGKLAKIVIPQQEPEPIMGEGAPPDEPPLQDGNSDEQVPAQEGSANE
ncbi:hypothetical protein NVV94_14930 [Pseudomonas sp. LS1212]|uniref:hypothetical protein n=1 Tax=Pseudomonas sp. LS1212 TaxID=2972478 RepID=UPI00215BA819|nr:hypothetical protein [Pseudomonas sp. LS1212]UVJ41982.1 hypothetical protein NVV94_14930 [Pseudomonas sp. LS1212]